MAATEQNETEAGRLARDLAVLITALIEQIILKISRAEARNRAAFDPGRLV